MIPSALAVEIFDAKEQLPRENGMVIALLPPRRRTVILVGKKEKFLDIKCRLANLKPNAVVIVATIRALKQHGGIALEDLKEENVEAMLAGCENLAKHIDTVQQFGLPYIVAINEFATDTPAEVAALEKWCEENRPEKNVPWLCPSQYGDE